MAALYDGDWDAAQASPQSHRSQAGGLVAAHLQWHLERQLRTLPLVERAYRVDRAVADHRASLFGQDVAHGDETGGQDHIPQLPPAPDDYPTFPDTSTWPVVFPELPPAPGGGPPGRRSTPRRPAAPQIPADQVPRHVAIVMDGNGRWASERGLNRTEGHKMGEAVLIDITCGAIELGIKHLTVYAFSTENWKRSTEEVRFLMGFNREVVRRRRENLNDHGRADALGGLASPHVAQRHQGVRHRQRGDGWQTMSSPSTTASTTAVAPRSSRPHNEPRAERPRTGRLNARPVSEATFAKHLHRADIPDVDLFIRTSGEQRASNFLLWQAAYAESCSRTSCGPTRPAGSVGSVRGVREPQPPFRQG